MNNFWMSRHSPCLKWAQDLLGDKMKGNNFSIVLTGEDFIGWVTLTRKLKDK